MKAQNKLGMEHSTCNTKYNIKRTILIIRNETYSMFLLEYIGMLSFSNSLIKPQAMVNYKKR